MARGEQAEKHLILTNQYALQYQDDTGDIINVSDDEDLHAAYEVADDALGGQLKLEVKPRPGQAPKVVPAEQEVIQPRQIQEPKVEAKPVA